MAKKIKYKNQSTDKNHAKQQLNRIGLYITSDDKALASMYNDPLHLNFKLIIDFDKTTGLLAKEENQNSALAYLKRIGETTRYELLIQFINILQTLVKDFDYLLLNVEGLDNVKLSKPWESFNEDDDKITLIFKETSDMLIESLISTYRLIWFDEDRCVEVLPSNLRGLDFSILVYSAGYFNMKLYDDSGVSEVEIEKLIFPTKRKLSEKSLYNKFNHMMFNFSSAKFDVTETGKNFFDSISNEPGGEWAKNNFTFTYKFASVKGRFNNIFGRTDYVAMMAILAAQNRVMGMRVAEEIEEGKSKRIPLKQQLKNSFNNVKNSTIKTLKKKGSQQLGKLTDSISPIGNLLDSLNLETAEMFIKNTIDLGIDKIEQKFINDPLARVNNMIFNNFSNNLYDLYKNNFGNNKTNKNVELITNGPAKTLPTSKHYNPEKIGSITKGISYGTGNAFNEFNNKSKF